MSDISEFPLSPFRDYYVFCVWERENSALCHIRDIGGPAWDAAYDRAYDARESLRVRMNSGACPPAHRVLRWDFETETYVPNG